MNPRWQQTLASRGATLDEAGLAVFPPAPPGAKALIADLGHLVLIGIEGRDAADFLQNQLTSDVAGLADGQWQWTGYCNAKGRLIATLRLMRCGDRFLAELPRTLAGDLVTRLSRYVLRSQVKIAVLAEETIGIGLAGLEPAVELGTASPGDHGIASVEGGFIVRAGKDRWHCYLTVDAAIAVWERLAARAAPITTGDWMRFDVADGIPWILPATRELFVPQMVDLERIGGVSFSKGCYPGQEIVARSQYLGEVKRRLHIAHTAAALDPGAPIGSAGQTAGNVVASAPAGDGGFRVLAVIDAETASQGNVSATTSGTRLEAVRRVHAPAAGPSR